MTVTPLYAGLLAILYTILTVRVIVMRGSSATSLGDGGNLELQRRIRGHGNFAEYVPFALLMLGLLELSGFSHFLLHALGLGLLLARVLHGYALSFSQSFKFGRMWGAALTFLIILLSGLLCLYQAWQAYVPMALAG